ncbi:hypothetical protein DERP_007364 [Dermatophagoides pteronyssinus]|uniref:Uncharacterized protein n=1 Tax=Dermatophagoides pteronyssinus TaxID=6956 RepID=A0ABQ8J495_DERPT|nr:hypothetical protein DERP_007364 [Dermatophagoides pteronyssinus]
MFYDYDVDDVIIMVKHLIQQQQQQQEYRQFSFHGRQTEYILMRIVLFIKNVSKPKPTEKI